MDYPVMKATEAFWEAGEGMLLNWLTKRATMYAAQAKREHKSGLFSIIGYDKRAEEKAKEFCLLLEHFPTAFPN